MTYQCNLLKLSALEHSKKDAGDPKFNDVLFSTVSCAVSAWLDLDTLSDHLGKRFPAFTAVSQCKFDPTTSLAWQKKYFNVMSTGVKHKIEKGGIIFVLSFSPHMFLLIAGIHG